MKQVLFALLFCIAATTGLLAQTDSNLLPACSYLKQQLRAAKHSIADPAEDNYDMQYLKLDLAVTNTSTYISGSATTRAKVVSASMPAYVFELTSLLTIDSVILNGQNLPVSSNDSVRTVTLPTALALNSSFTVQVYYHGAPVYPAGFFAGIASDVSPTWGTQVTYTISESYHALGWWPTKQSLTDKLDSCDVWITVDTSLKAGSNGSLQHITPVAPGKVRYEWKEHFPIDYYLVSIAVAPYIDYSYYMHFANSNDSMLVQNYVYNNPATLPAFQSYIDSTGMMVDYFSTIYGRYKFWTEKYGHCLAPIGGGMEHQTMTTLGYFHGTLIAHELSHQWFGDNVTCGSWADIWMNEGFASYSEYLFVKHFWSDDSAFAYMAGYHSTVYGNPTGSVYCTDTTDENRIFDGRLTYSKGASVLHMLHFLSGNDSVYFHVCKNYQQQNSGGNGTTTTLKNTAEAVLGQNLDTFFTQWVYKEGWPIYSLRWAQAGNQIIIRVDQTTAMPNSVQFFVTPIELKLNSATGDTIIKIYNNATVQHYLVDWSRTMTGLQVDPNDWLLKQVSSVNNDPSLLHTSNLIRQELSVSPNPTADQWQLNAVPQDCHLQVYDVTGRTVWQSNNMNAFSITIPAANLPAGFYILQLTAAGKTASVKLVKQ